MLMKRKKILMVALATFSMHAAAQQNGNANLENIDWEEDTAKVISIADIMKMQQDVSSLGRKQTHFAEVWGYRTFLNLSYCNNKLTPKEAISLGVGQENVPEFKSNWGVSLKWGNNYRLHKKAIANMVSINLDFTWTDLNVSHYKVESDEKNNLYDSNNTYPWTKGEETKDYHYLPWKLEKYDFNYSISLGPSVTVAPFTTLNARALHYIKFNVYYHIGYNASLMLMKNDKGKADINAITKTPTFSAQQPRQPEPYNYNDQDSYNQAITLYNKQLAQYEADKSKYEQDVASYRNHEDIKSSQLVIGHGLTHSIGFNVTWKFIGLGYEHRTSSMKFQSLDTGHFSNKQYKFKSSISRVYLQFRF